MRCGAGSGGLPHRREGLRVLDAQRGAHAARAPVLELHLRLDELLGAARVERIDQHAVLVGDEAAADLVGAREFAVVRVQLLVQHQEAGDLAAREQAVGREVGVHLLHAVADQRQHLGLGGEVGVARIRQVLPLGPVAHGLEIDVDQRADLVAAVAERHGLLDVREELELVLHVLGREHRAVVRAAREAPHVLHAVDDLELAARIEKARIARAVPAVRREHFRGRLGVLVVAAQQARGLHEDLAVAVHLDLHPADRHAHGVGMHRVVGLQADEHRRLGGSVELLEVDADRAVEGEQVRSDRLARRIGHAHPREAQRVAQRPIDQQIACRIAQPVPPAHRLAALQRRAHAARMRHAGAVQPALEGARVLHADRHAGEQPFEDARRREVVGGPDLLEVDRHRGRGFGAIHHVAARQPLRVAEDVLPDPGGRQVGEHIFCGGEPVELGTGRGAVQQRGMRVHHALGVARGAGGEEHRGHVIGLHGSGARGEPARYGAGDARAVFQQRIDRLQARLVIVAQAARIVVEDTGDGGALRADLQQLVHLLLVLHHAEAHLGIVQRIDAFGGHGVLVERNGNGAQRLRREHRGVEPRAVRTDHHEVLAARKTRGVQARGEPLHQLREACPGGRLPDAVFLLAQRGGLGALGRVAQQQSGKGVAHAGSCRRWEGVGSCPHRRAAVPSRRLQRMVGTALTPSCLADDNFGETPDGCNPACPVASSRQIRVHGMPCISQMNPTGDLERFRMPSIPPGADAPKGVPGPVPWKCRSGPKSPAPPGGIT